MNPKKDILKDAEQLLDSGFLREYQALCQKYRRALVPSLQFQIVKLNEPITKPNEDDNRNPAGVNPSK